MSAIEGFDIRYSELSDLSYLDAWFSESGACDLFPFTFEEREEALKNWIGFAKYRASLTGTLQESPCAIGTLFLMPYRKVAHHCSFYLIVDPKVRRRGIGTSMIRNLFHLAKTRFRLESVHIEIFGENPLTSLLRMLDFQEIVRQDDFFNLRGVRQPRVLWEKRLP